MWQKSQRFWARLNIFFHHGLYGFHGWGKKKKIRSRRYRGRRERRGRRFLQDPAGQTKKGKKSESRNSRSERHSRRESGRDWTANPRVNGRDGGTEPWSFADRRVGEQALFCWFLSASVSLWWTSGPGQLSTSQWVSSKSEATSRVMGVAAGRGWCWGLNQHVSSP